MHGAGRAHAHQNREHAGPGRATRGADGRGGFQRRRGYAAGRPIRLGALEIPEGQSIALLDGELVAAGDSLVEALLVGTRCASPPTGGALTLYYGQDVAPRDAAEAEARLAAEWPERELQVL